MISIVTLPPVLLLVDHYETAQRLAAQPLGRFRFLVTILAGNLKSQSSVLSLSLDQVGCSRGLGVYFIFPNYLVFRINMGLSK